MIGFQGCETERISQPSGSTVKTFDRIPSDRRLKKLDAELSSTTVHKSSEESISPKQPCGELEWIEAGLSPPQDEAIRAQLWPSSSGVLARFVQEKTRSVRKVLFLNRPKLKYPRPKTPECEELLDSWHPDEAALKSGPGVMKPLAESEKPGCQNPQAYNFSQYLSRKQQCAARPRFLSDGDFSRPILQSMQDSPEARHSNLHSGAMSNYRPLTLVVGSRDQPAELSYSAYKSNLRTIRNESIQAPLASILSKKSLGLAGTDSETPGASSERLGKKKVRFSTKNIMLVYQNQPPATSISAMQ